MNSILLKYQEALDVFEKEMIEKDRFKPTLWLYKTIMAVLAHAGHTEQVFEIFRKV